LFDIAFTLYWLARPADDQPTPPGARQRSLATQAHRMLDQARTSQQAGVTTTQLQRHPQRRLNQLKRRPSMEEADAGAQATVSWSADEALRRKDFEDFTPDELADAKRLLERIRWRLSLRTTRRRRSAPRGDAPDLRRTLRAAMRTGGEPLRLSWRRPRKAPRPLVILCDISGSMSLYSRLFLHFVHTVANGLDRVEVFVFGTRLTRITRQLARRSVDEAVTRVTTSVSDWSGGTRIGESLRTFNRLWARRVLGRGAVALIISDGWDRGDVRVLADEMARLRRNCHRVIWLNPLLGHEDYLPVASGMRAALPYIDDFLPANTLKSLIALGHALEGIGDERAPGRVRPVAIAAANGARSVDTRQEVRLGYNGVARRA
ncbi:MAG TPA: VWA domain-containing protein, partial [Ktedonobacterales bacterium]